jgi:hypothetical protein
MSDGSIKITIGAAMDRSVETVFGQIEKRAQRAAQNIGKSFGQSFGGGSGGGGGSGKGFESAVASAKKAEAQIEREIAKQVAATKAGAREMAREHAKSSAAAIRASRDESREIIKNFRDIIRDRKREFDKQAREEKRISSESRSFGRNVGMYAVRNMSPNAMSAVGAGRRVVNDIARGAGVDFSLASSVSRAVALESGSVQLANQERIATGSTIGSKKWNSMSRGIAGKFSADANDVQGMMLAMTAKTGEFSNAKGMGEDLAGLSVASGANMRDMGNAAGYVYNQLKNLPDAGKRTIEVMRGIVGQTAVGAVDMPDYAVQLGRIAANASKFDGSVDENIRKQSALAQLAVESGGASSPADAARSVASFSNTFGKHARIAAFKKEGVDLFTNSKQDTLRDPFEIIKDTFRNTHGDIEKISSMFADTLGRKPVQALHNAYKAAGGEEAGIKAIEASFAKYMRANLDPKTEAQNIKDYQESTAAKAIKFQNALDNIVVTMSDSVFPALEKLAPYALSAAGALAKVVAMAADHPKTAIAAAFGLAIAQAGIQATIRLGLEKGLEAFGPTMMQLMSAGLGKTFAALAIAWPVIVAAALAAAANEAMNRDIAGRTSEQTSQAIAHGDAMQREGGYRSNASRGVQTAGEKEDLEAINKNLEFRVQAASALPAFDKAQGGAPTTSAGIAFETLMRPDVARARADATQLESLKKELADNKRILDMIRTGELRVKVTNPQEFKTNSPLVDPAGRGRPPGYVPNWVER